MNKFQVGDKVKIIHVERLHQYLGRTAKVIERLGNICVLDIPHAGDFLRLMDYKLERVKEDFTMTIRRKPCLK